MLGEPNEGAKILLEAIPADKVECFYYYQLTSNPSGDTNIDTLLSGIAYSYVDKLAELILSHRSYIQNYFRFGYLQDGEFTEDYASSCAWLMEQDCVWFFKELNKSNSLVEERIMDIIVNLGRPNIDCLRNNRNQILKKYLDVFHLSN
jgi:hypothetical protein